MGHEQLSTVPVARIIQRVDERGRFDSAVHSPSPIFSPAQYPVPAIPNATSTINTYAGSKTVPTQSSPPVKMTTQTAAPR